MATPRREFRHPTAEDDFMAVATYDQEQRLREAETEPTHDWRAAQIRRLANRVEMFNSERGDMQQRTGKGPGSLTTLPSGVATLKLRHSVRCCVMSLGFSTPMHQTWDDFVESKTSAQHVHTYKLQEITRNLKTVVIDEPQVHQDSFRHKQMGEWCIVCRDEKIVIGGEAPCGHVCCALCMVTTVLELKKCPHCRHEVKFEELLVLKRPGAWSNFKDGVLKYGLSGTMGAVVLKAVVKFFR
ncbi:unnamed protein product [Zymoseptoria tritici ST99CH_1E4]|uniref:RING-type domain-containing protein n=1 Tax=Zymoseptoria tritici ST99CH_1E4 TaxID=1276532 RepID=A0A2H1GQ02_ZYMTR|nr:unnamed protein product [Zymoseptoria tritici ST99CH_1E4]